MPPSLPYLSKTSFSDIDKFFLLIVVLVATIPVKLYFKAVLYVRIISSLDKSGAILRKTGFSLTDLDISFNNSSRYSFPCKSRSPSVLGEEMFTVK